ncbi:MAG: YdcF family protein [Candidatus Buchananbacteria bacterium]
MENKNQILAAAKKIWDYHHLNHKLEKADCILVLGSNDLRVAKRGAQLFLEGFAPYIVFSGTGFGHKNDLLSTSWSKWQKSEAEVFAEAAEKLGVPKAKIIIEKESQNTGQNIINSKKLLASLGLNPKKIILVQKPYMERRAYATFKNFWPKAKVIVTSPQLSFEKYPNKEISKDKLINIMVGDLQRIKIYPEKGFQIPQEIPDDVWQAYEKLIAAGYDKHLVK